MSQSAATEAVRVGVADGTSVRELAETTGWSVGWVSELAKTFRASPASGAEARPTPDSPLAPEPDVLEEPVDTEATQRALVGRLLVTPEVIPHVAASLLPEDLNEPLSVILTSILMLHAAGEAIGPIDVGVHLYRRGKLAAVGGSAFLTELARAGEAPAPVVKPPTHNSAWFAQPVKGFPYSGGFATAYEVVRG